MSRWKSAEEVRAGYIEAMGQELGEVFHATSHELTWLHWRWKQYRTLFGEKPSRIVLLNEASPLFFRIVQDVFFEDTLLAIARLVGPAMSRNKPNLTIERFPPLLGDRSLRDQTRKLIDRAEKAAAFAIDWRNRHLAHRDLNLALKPSSRPLAKATRERVEVTLSALREVLNHIELAYCDATTAYADSPTPGDAEDLLYVIRDGLDRDREKRARWNRGQFHHDDIKTPEAI